MSDSRLRRARLKAHWWVRRQLSRWLYERRLKIDTGGRYSRGEPELGDWDYLWYQPSPWTAVRTALRRYRVSREDVFIDLGSGKGRVVLQAASGYPFKRVIGVELSPELNEVARANLEANRKRLKCTDVQLETADLTEYEVPDEVTFAYLANSVTGDAFSAMLAQMLRSLDRRPRRLTLIYMNPTEHDRVMATGRARMLREHRRNALREVPLRIYELSPAAAADQ